MRFPARFTLVLLAGLFAGVTNGCVEESSIPVVFDQELHSVTFENRLLAGVVLMRNDQVLDTLPARVRRSYAINQKGIFRHSWRLIPPISVRGRAQGVAPSENFGIQYDIDAEYVIDNSSSSFGTIFTPRIVNFSFRDVLIYANYREQDEFLSDYLVRSNSVIDDEHAPYYYWHSSSNVLLVEPGSSLGTIYRRGDTTGYALEMETISEYSGSGATMPITVR